MEFEQLREIAHSVGLTSVTACQWAQRAIAADPASNETDQPAKWVPRRGDIARIPRDQSYRRVSADDVNARDDRRERDREHRESNPREVPER